MESKPFKCLNCNTPFQLESFLKNSFRFWPATGTFASKCPHCGTIDEYAVRNGKLYIGYLYAAATAHFNIVHQLNIPEEIDIQVVEDGLKIKTTNFEQIIPYAETSQ
ncbi:MAG: hypothetical protein KDK41_10545 [Leptospiraceae bacterium]|nr:hypothetical protein [Leptospiraceae bacterium]